MREYLAHELPFLKSGGWGGEGIRINTVCFFNLFFFGFSSQGLTINHT